MTDYDIIGALGTATVPSLNNVETDCIGTQATGLSIGARRVNNGDVLRGTAQFVTAANGNNKRVRLYLNGTSFFDHTFTDSNKQIRVWWEINGLLQSTSKICGAWYSDPSNLVLAGAVVYVQDTAITSDMTTAIIFRATMLSATQAADVICQALWFGRANRGYA